MPFDILIRPLRREDVGAWAELRRALWPEEDPAELEREAREELAHTDRTSVFVADVAGGEVVGFVEAALRDVAEGCQSWPVGYVEAWYVAPEFRRAGLGAQLLAAAERWAREKGCSEMGSDALLSNALIRPAVTPRSSA